MLSERQLARGFSEVWRRWTPHLDARLLAMLKPDGAWSQAIHRWDSPMNARVPAGDNDVVAEIAFGVFCAGLEDPRRSPREITGQLMESVVDEALERVALLRRAESLPRKTIEWTHLADAQELAARLTTHLDSFRGDIRVHERLEGAGVLAACHPDVMQGDSIVEVKMSKLSFRSADLRQLIVYAAMAHWNHQPARELALVNPRLGLTWRFSVEDLIGRVADTTPPALFSAMERFVSQELLAW